MYLSERAKLSDIQPLLEDEIDHVVPKCGDPLAATPKRIFFKVTS